MLAVMSRAKGGIYQRQINAFALLVVFWRAYIIDRILYEPAHQLHGVFLGAGLVLTGLICFLFLLVMLIKIANF